MKTICTITTYSHLAQTLALRDSALKFSPDSVFCVLIIDNGNISHLNDKTTIFYTLQDIGNACLAMPMIKKYNKDKDQLRWSLKPVFMHFLLLNCGYSKTIYVDNDIFFFNNVTFLFDELDQKDILLCPHWRCTKPSVNKNWFIVNFTDGFYNAGFFAAGKNGLEALKWWAEACYFKCAKILRKGLFDDQKYLDFLPVIFENVGIIKHRGCNVAYWNQIENIRVKTASSVLINGQWDIIFIHFTKELIKAVKTQKDPHLTPHLEIYKQAVDKYL